MKTDIFIVSYEKDIPYLDYCLRSIDKFATGFNNRVLVVPSVEEPLFHRFCEQAVIKTYERVPDQRRWQINAQLAKMRADEHCEGDFIFMIDSDCCFIEPVTPDDYFLEGKPVMLIREYSTIPTCPWKQPTEQALGHECLWETMARHGQINPRGLFAPLRLHIAAVNKMPFDQYVLSRKPDFCWGISEHNCIGAYALHHPYWTTKYHWIDTAKAPTPKPKIFQAWSHSPPDQEQDNPNGGRKKPLDVYREIGIA